MSSLLAHSCCSRSDHRDGGPLVVVRFPAGRPDRDGGGDPAIGRCLLPAGRRHGAALFGRSPQRDPGGDGSNLRPKMVVVVDPDIDVHDSEQVEWAMAFRTQPARDVIIVDSLPGGPLDPTADESLPADQRTGSAIGIDATYPYGTVVKQVGDLCGPASEEHGGHVVEVADVPGWRDYDFPELDAR